jgi:hypothetical protein
LSQDRATRFVVAWAGGPRENELSETVVQATRQRTKGQVGIPYLSDGGEPCETAIKVAYWQREPWQANPNSAIPKPTEGVRLT